MLTLEGRLESSSSTESVRELEPSPASEQTLVEISIGSRYDHIDRVQGAIDEALARLGLDEDTRHRVGVATREAVANAIKHANRRDPGKEVDVALAVAGDQAVIRVADRGEGFDPRAVADPRTPENRLRPGGRGIFCMKSFMDDVQYFRRSGGGTVVVMRKRLRAADRPDTDRRGVR